jgi:hypothetical protein
MPLGPSAKSARTSAVAAVWDPLPRVATRAAVIGGEVGMGGGQCAANRDGGAWFR